ncbi:o-succinylbenzoate synthase [Fulvivirga lutimaris]|uniref:o-succinylbenzoate synthase n=1 Tax=Fulvivirga lutimaris TaxID=1819566 RepID=UPI0012BB8223|nr:o-succinylbenzoate synthase [Fulvivirga lutimaris]MTI40674.1 o-succinylbenzoate synthase [Fulvivirga lutimaris]
MALQYSIHPYTLDFKFPAGTSRGVLKVKETFIIKVWAATNTAIFGLGECGPLKKLSIDDKEELQPEIDIKLKALVGFEAPKSEQEIFDMALEVAGYEYPALRFAIETALLDLINGGKRLIYKTNFYEVGEKIPINGLIWMGHMEAMLLQISDKITEGFDCIKMKVGSLDFEKEIDILHYIRRKYYTQDILVRVDANGAFKPEEALYKMEAMARHGIHSIEQPIAVGQHDLMTKLCAQAPIDIALDEELIGANTKSDKVALLEKIKPQYIIIKPTLIGGLQSSTEWIEIANGMNIGWWITSALESNIGLNAISQLASKTEAKSYQGLGTGKLYHNNIESPLTVSAGHIVYDQNKSWDLSFLDNDHAE